MKRTLLIAAGISVIGIGLSTTYVISAEKGTAAERDACTPDVYRLCQAEIPDEDRIVACLKKNKKQLSPACHKVLFD